MRPLQDSASTSVAMTDLGERPADDVIARARRQAGHHRWLLAIACAIWLLAVLLQELPDGRVAFRGLPQLPLPQICASRVLFGFRCPGCGLTRSIIDLAAGDWRASWDDHRLGGLLALVIAAQIPYRLYVLRRPERPPLAIRWQIVLAYTLVALLLGNWLFDVAAGRLSSP
jgi:Protein of unknown function (DUF2752)